MKEEDCKRMYYIEKMTLSEARTLFQHRTNMTKMQEIIKDWENTKEKEQNVSFA